MDAGRVLCVGTHSYSFRAGEPAEVIGVVMAAPGDRERRPCFRIRFDDGKEDFVSIFAAPGSKTKNPHIELIDDEDLDAGRIPAVDR